MLSPRGDTEMSFLWERTKQLYDNLIGRALVWDEMTLWLQGWFVRRTGRLPPSNVSMIKIIRMGVKLSYGFGRNVHGTSRRKEIHFFMYLCMRLRTCLSQKRASQPTAFPTYSRYHAPTEVSIGLYSSGMLRGIHWWLVTKVSGQLSVLSSKAKQSKDTCR
jgi:hypothetical protein